ncbi:hypothetical protein IFM89_014261 [Coptis chinensis]|uniref:1-phosphatidylinositol-3-phosphate 5-kinase n=1 Tax=Coptis chinensis TaxID=261450 RepID=A0A835H511_9MAGN|nr:hypothetical protein IFM89_014261 [Coptis chinensis]
MGIPDSTLFNIIEKFKTWIGLGGSDISSVSQEHWISGNSRSMCCDCKTQFMDCSAEGQCRSCGQLLCGRCLQGASVAESDGRRCTDEGEESLKLCKYCSYNKRVDPSYNGKFKNDNIKSFQNDHLLRFLGAKRQGSSKLLGANSSLLSSSSDLLSPLSFHRSSSRSDDEDAEDSDKHFFSPSSESCRDISDIDSCNVSARHEFLSVKSVGSSPLDSPSRMTSTPRSGYSVQQEQEGSPVSPNDDPHHQEGVADSKRFGVEFEDRESTDYGSDDMSIFRGQCAKLQQTLNFECNGPIWLPPPPDDKEDEMENRFFEYDDEDEDVGESGIKFTSSNFSTDIFPTREKANKEQKEPLQAVVHGHYRALVSQLLQEEGIYVENEDGGEVWLDIVTSIAWQAANFVKPDTKKGGSMDPGDYVKVKCIVSGTPCESTLVKGVVCTKNIKHKRMTSQYKNAKLLLLGGALEYQRATNQLASFDTLLQQVLLRGAPREVLKKVKRVVQYAVFAAYHLSLETSFLADEGATFLKMPLKSPVAITGRMMNADTDAVIFNSSVGGESLIVEDQPEGSCECSMSRNSSIYEFSDVSSRNNGTMTIFSEFDNGTSSLNHSSGCRSALCTDFVDSIDEMVAIKDWMKILFHELSESPVQQEEGTITPPWETTDDNELTRVERANGNEVVGDYFSTVDNHQSILVSFSSRCALKGTVCERSQLLRIKFYGSFDKPLGRYLRDDLFDQASYCRSCKGRTDAHIRCYTHQQGSLTINVRRLLSVELPGEHDGKIWMWHRCLKCAHVDGVPPANRRVVMSDAAWGLSFGKFLELSFSNHATANRVASCGHSLQRDCLRFYGFGRMIAFFHYSPIDILSVCLPPSLLDFSGQFQQDWVKREAIKVSNEMEVLYAEVYDVLHSIEQRASSLGQMYLDESEVLHHITDLKVLLKEDRNEYEVLLYPTCIEDFQNLESSMDILELNRLRRCLLMDSFIWDRRLYSLDTLLKCKTSMPKIDSHILEVATYAKLKEWRDESFFRYSKCNSDPEERMKSLALLENPRNQPKEDFGLPFLDPNFNEQSVDQLITKSVEGCCLDNIDLTTGSTHKSHKHDCDVLVEETSSTLPSPASCLSDKIDSAWTGTGLQPAKVPVPCVLQPDGKLTGLDGDFNQVDTHSCRALKSPVRVYSFDSALRIQEKIQRGLSPSLLQLSSLRSFHASGEFRSMVRDPIPNILRTLSQTSSREVQNLSFIFNSMPVFISSASRLSGEGIRWLLPETGCRNIVVPVYDNEPTSVVSYALGSKEYEDWIADRFDEHGGRISNESSREDELINLSGYHSAWQSFASLDSEDIICRSHETDDALMRSSSLFSDQKRSPHFRISFEDEYSSSAGKVKFSVICYFARQFDALRKKCCPDEVDFIRSLSRCSRWDAQGGKSNVYFAKSFDERFIIKQVTKTELDSFEEFAPEYFKYLTDSLSSGSPTCLAKVLGVYQVTVKHPKGVRQSKLEIMVMENLFFKRNISRVYDLKGSARSRYNPDATGKNKVLLDMNLLETLCTNPIFLGSKAKRSLERAVWNDTYFLASVDVMDYSLLVGVDDERQELVLGIIDFMRQYTWDKHLETWVKASGILGGPKNASPTVVSPMQYKKRFRKAMSTYFLTVPDQWSP